MWLTFRALPEKSTTFFPFASEASKRKNKFFMPEKKLKILHTMTWLAPGGGVDKNVYFSIDDLKDEFEFHLAVGKDIFHNDFKNIEGLPIFICENLERTLKPWKDFKSIFYFYRLIKKEKYDIVHTHETKASLISRIAAWFAGCPYIIYGLHGVTFNDPLSKARRLIYILIEKTTMWMCDYVVSVSKNTLDIYHEHNLGKNIPSQVAYSGIDTQHFIKSALNPNEKQALRAKLGFKETDKIIVNIGRFSFAKAQRYTIECFSKVKKTHPEAKLLFVGDGELMDDCKKQLEELGLKNDVVFYGFCENIAPLLYISDIMMLTSLREGLPRVVVEAALCKIPTVAFEVEGIREIVVPQFHEFIVPQYDVEGLTEKTLKLLKSSDIYQNYTDTCFAHAVQNWDFKEMTRRLRNIYLKKQ
jgi:glycosyltransferase involved in cell wall biosynthesis